MALNKHFNVDTYKFEDRPKPKLWLLKPNGQRIERIAGVSKLQGTFKYTNLNQITFQISPTMFDGIQHQQVKNTVFDKIRNKYIIELKYNNFRDYFVIDDLKEVSDDSENIQVVADSLGSELNGKPMSEIEMLGSTIEEMYEKVFENYAPLWKLEFVDSKVKEVKRELTAQQGTVMSASEQINTLFDTITIFDNINRKISVYHKDSVGINRGLRVRENSYLKSFEDSMVSKDIITRLIPIGSNGLTIHSANPAGSDYIEDFSFFIKPFKRDANRNVLEHSDYMSDELCHALLDYDEFYNSKKEEIDEFTKRYSEILKQHSEEDFKLKSLNAIVERQEDRIELLKPKSEYIDLGVKTKNFNITVAKSSYYILMLKNEGTLVNIKFDGKTHQLKSGEWTYIKIDTADFEDATKVDEKLQYKIEMLSATTRVHAVITRSSKDDYDEEDTKKIEEKYNYLKYSQLRDEQQALVSSIERRMKQFEEEKADLVASMNPKLFLSEELYKEREQFVYGAIWQEENHTDAKELYDDAEKQLKKKNNVTRSLNVGIVNFIQSLEHKEDWDKLNVGDKIVFSNKFFNKKLKAYITEMQIGFDENSINLTLSDVFDYKDDMQRVSELIANTSSTSNQVNMQKEQIKDSQGKITKMTELIEGEWDANKKRVLAGNETVDIGSHGVKVISNEDPNEFVIMVGGVIAMTKDGGETFKTGVTPEGVNAEMLIGKMIIGEDLWLENESGTMRFNKDGFHIDASLFHLTTNEGKEDYFSKLKNEIQEENKQLETRIKDEYTRKINNAIQESLDVENMIDNVSNVLKDTFSDGIITDVEKKLINDTLSSLEKENAENVQQIEMALNHPYVTNDDIVELDQAYTIYDGMYEALVQSIHESIADNIITSDESIRVNEAVVQFRDEVKEIMVLVKQILETTRDNQLNQKIEESLDYTTRLNKDLKDEMNDLNKAFETTKETIDKALEDGVFDAAEIEAIKTALMIMKSEQQDILNRYEQIVANEKLPADARARIVKSHNEYVAAFKDFNDYVLEMISDGVSNDTERENYQAKFDILTQKNSVFTQDYTYALQAIALQYTQDAEGKLQEQYDGLKMEIAADLKDVRDNMTELENIFDDAFKDGIVTEAEVTRLQVHLDMLDREYLDVDERYKTLVNDTRIEQSIRTELASKRSAYASSHSNLRVIINQVIEDRKVTAEEKTQVNNALSTYNTSFAAFSKVIQIAMNNLSQNLANSAAENKKQEMIDELNKYKETVSNDFTELNGKVDNFEETIWDSFEDQIIETSEAAAINQYINILANEKGRIEKQYTVIVNNKDLVGSPKTQLSNSYGALISSYDALIETIQSAIADNKIIETERTAVNQKFADYKVKLSDYEDKINKAIDAIIKNVATSEANKVNERFETWKSSEFVVESEKISQRVSGTNWEETYLPLVNDKVGTVQESINTYATTIEANSSFIEQNKNQILSSVSKSEVDATLSKIATYETSYQIKNKAQKTLLEYNGIEFNDNYSYEVVAKARYDGYDTLAVATFISKGKGKGFELTIIDQKGTTGAHPLFELVNNKPSISLYSNMVTEYVVDVIYTKYLGSASNIERTNSQIKQMSDNITLQVDRIHEELDATNILINSEFNNNAETWTYAYSPDNFTIPDKSEMSINIDGNLILNGFYRDDITGVTTSYRRVTFKLAEPLTVGKTYTLAFNLEVIKGDNSGKMEVYSYSPAGTREVIDVSTINRNTHTFIATAPSTEILIYNGLSGTSENVNTDVALSKATLIEGTKPLPYRYGSSKNVAKMQYINNINYPSLISNYISVGKAGELSVGDTITCSSYVYVPSSAKGKLTGLIYFSIATYESNKQTSNPNSGIFSLSPSDIIYDTWVRYSFTTTIPASSSNGKTNYLRMLLRFDGNEQAVDKDVVFYYGLPQLELDASPTRWTPSKVDALSTEALASKIALNPESIDIISENLNINTDVLTIKNTNGNLMMKGDTLSVSNNNNTNEVKINSNGISIKKDGMNKIIDGLDRGAQSVFPYLPRMPSFTKSVDGGLRAQHVSDSSNDYVEAGYYTVYWGTYQKGKNDGSLIGSNNDHGRVNRFTYFHEKRYLRLDTTCTTEYVNLYVKVEDPSGGSNTNLAMFSMSKSDANGSRNILVDLGKPTYKDRTLEITMGITGGSDGRNNAKMRIRIMKLTDYNE
ncbi:hypothetical protein [Mammaliicoccus lentus]|uniref:hypothetical protein n=1 Tax=Mammaliicoccus lentus TaxID=42858 RepID=UPI00107214F9|nr:hypothetical protein [Mammaliicoccus lentus]MBF0793430.1 hypothetical protein [Mammaliicoccus lentus]TFV17926.1 hypothetical protein E4T78_02095 [Mammaliicoccus lentus]